MTLKYSDAGKDIFLLMCRPFVDQVSYFIMLSVDGLAVSMIVESLTTAQFVMFSKMADCRVPYWVIVDTPVGGTL